MDDGIKTFPFPVKLDDRIALVEAEFGCKGFATVWKLHQAIGARGYYLKWDIDTQLLFIRDYHLSEVGRSCVSEIVACCLRRGVFEPSLYEKYGILTSERIQETFLTAKERSKKVIVNKDYALPIVYTFIENANKKNKNANIFWKNADISEQRKGEEKKGKENKVVGLSDDDYADLCNRIGKENCDYYIERVTAFKARNPQATFDVKTIILKWWREDKAKEDKANTSPSFGFVTDESAAALNAAFEKLNEDL